MVAANRCEVPRAALRQLLTVQRTGLVLGLAAWDRDPLGVLTKHFVKQKSLPVRGSSQRGAAAITGASSTGAQLGKN